MKRVCLITCLVFILFQIAPAQDLNLNNYDSETFINLSRAMGHLLSSGLYHSASVHRFGGVDLGMKAMFGFIPDDNQTGPLGGVRTIFMPAFQANIGILGRFDVGGRVFNFDFGDDNKEKVRLTSGIIKFRLISGLLTPDITIFSSYSKISGISDISLKCFSIGGIIGQNLPVVSFYAGFNYNFTTMDVNLEPDLNYPVGFSKSYSVKEPQLTIGFAFGLVPFTKINLEYAMDEFNQSATFGVMVSIF